MPTAPRFPDGKQILGRAHQLEYRVARNGHHGAADQLVALGDGRSRRRTRQNETRREDRDNRALVGAEALFFERVAVDVVAVVFPETGASAAAMNSTPRTHFTLFQA